LVGARHPGYRWDTSDASYGADVGGASAWSGSLAAAAAAAPTVSGEAAGGGGLGSGAALCQLGWAGEAFTVNPADGTPLPLALPVLEHLEASRAK
jgi:hypothetical protein